MNKPSRIDFNSVVGILLAAIAIAAGQTLEGGHIGSLLQAAAFVIVVGGTLGAVLLQTKVKVFVNGMKMGVWVFYPPSLSPQITISQIIHWAQISRKEGLLALERYAEVVTDPLARKGLQLLADGSQPDKLREVMEIECYSLESYQRKSARIWEAAGGYAPTIGILGAVLGLIQVMENLSDPERLGEGVAVAFVATVYGVALANLVFLPIANKLKHIIEEYAVMREILVDGLVAIADGENPRLIESRLKGYIV
ncbi:MAG: flagellar motor protein [Nitrosomonas sp.]|nr:flagellar motor protein [Nitrosomonas sp.]MDP1950033.1 flagellar motor protein [Nitrosomonas sp.]